MKVLHFAQFGGAYGDCTANVGGLTIRESVCTRRANPSTQPAMCLRPHFPASPFARSVCSEPPSFSRSAETLASICCPAVSMTILASQGSYSRAHISCHAGNRCPAMSAIRVSALRRCSAGPNRRSQIRCNACLLAGRLSAKRLALTPPGSQNRLLRCGPVSNCPQRLHKRPYTLQAPISLCWSCVSPVLWNRCADETPVCHVPVRWQLQFFQPRASLRRSITLDRGFQVFVSQPTGIQNGHAFYHTEPDWPRVDCP